MTNRYAIDHIIGDSAWAQSIRKRILQVAAYDYSVLIAGPSGTGKELVARAVHAHSARAVKPFVPVDCATIPGGLFASQLFGHVKGAFTGAASASMGCFRAADGGTLFLDEIGEMDLDLQASLLRVLQERQVVPVGGHDPIPVNVRVIAATNRDLQQEVKAGRFRLDLYYRLNVVRMETLGLKDRPEDVEILAEHFLAKAAVDNCLPLKRLSRSALAMLQCHDWPGNVRELQHTIERAMVFHEGNTLDPDAFEGLAEQIGVPPEALIASHDLQVQPAQQHQPQQTTAPSAAVESALTDADLARLQNWPTIDQVEAEHIRVTLKETFYNQSAAARLLGIDRKQLARKIKKFGLVIPRLSPGRPANR